MNNNVTFSQKVKNEILNNEKTTSECCLTAYLAAIIRGAGSLSISNEGLGFNILTGNLELLKFVNQITARLYGKQSDIVVEGTKGKQMFSMDCYDKKLMYDTGILAERDGMTEICDNIDIFRRAEQCCKKAYIKGMYLACGSITIPEIKNIKQENPNASYHLEFQLNDTKIANEFCELLNDEGFAFKVTERAKNNVVYIKDKDSISDLIVYFGANGCKFAMEDVMIARSIRNTANRQTNCINANIDKALEASEKQIFAITKLIESGKLNLLDEKLKQTADARMERPDATMDELAEILGVTKSGVNHRIRKILEYAADLEEK